MSELINEWNQIIEYEIMEKDLKQPTYEFFYSALESLLAKLNVNVDAIKARIPEQDFDRLFNIAFVHYVDALYRISNPANRLYYMDLMRPSAKKCTHVLKTLLNYLHYVEMVKNQVQERTSKLLKNHNDALTERNDLQTKNELMKQRSNKINEELDKFTQKIPQHEQTIKELNEKRQALSDEKSKLLADITEMEREQLKMDFQKSELKQQIVTDEHYKSVCQKLAGLKEECDNIRKLHANNHAVHNKFAAEIKDLNNKYDKLIAMNDEHQKKHIKAAGELLVKLAEIKKKYGEATAQNKIVDHSINQLEKLLADFTIEYEKLENEVLELAKQVLKVEDVRIRRRQLVTADLKHKYQEYQQRFDAIIHVNEYLLKVWQRVLNNILSVLVDLHVCPDSELVPEIIIEIFQ